MRGCVVGVKTQLVKFFLSLTLATVLPSVVRAEKANVFFIHDSGSLARSRETTEFLRDERLGTRQSANPSLLRASVTPCEKSPVPCAPCLPTMRREGCVSLFVPRRAYENRFRVAPAVRVRAATAARWRFVVAQSAGVSLTSVREFC